MCKMNPCKDVKVNPCKDAKNWFLFFFYHKVKKKGGKKAEKCCKLLHSQKLSPFFIPMPQETELIPSVSPSFHAHV